MFVDVLFALLIQWCIYVLYIQISHHFLTYLNLVLAHFDYFEVTHTTYRHISVLGTYCGVIYRCNTFLHNSFRHLMKHIHRLVNYYTNWLIKTQPNIFLTFDISVSGKQRLSSEEVCLLPLPVLTTIVMRRKEGQSSMNRDEGSDTLSHTYDRFLATSHHYRGKNRKRK